MVVLPDPLGPSSPMTSPASTSSETRFTARRGPYHFVSCSATMTGDIPPGKRPAGRLGRPADARQIIPDRPRVLLEHLWRVRRPGLRGWAIQVVGGHEARILTALQHADIRVRAEDPRRVVGEGYVGE